MTRQRNLAKPGPRGHIDKYAKPPNKRVPTGFCDPPKWIIVKFIARDKVWRLEKQTKGGGILYWLTKDAAQQTLDSMRPSIEIVREVRRMYVDEYKEHSKNLVLVKPKSESIETLNQEPQPIETEVKTMAKTRVRSTGCLVEIFEDLELRKFAISTTASNEAEFISEFSQAIAAAPTTDWNTRMKEFLPLVVEMCCKYRGYKTDRVQERRELVAGDLEIPS